jgi:hypothetical protein
MLLSTLLLTKENIRKYRDPSLQLEGIIAALKRLDEHHIIVPTLTSKKSSLQAGIGGEERVQAALSNHTFPDNFHFFYDLTLSSFCKFQLDAFLLTPYYGLIFEIKNISGTLKFLDNPPQLIQTKESGEVIGLDSPAAQVEQYAQYLSHWMAARNLQLPIHRVVVLAYPKQKVERAPAQTKILFPSLLASYIISLPQDRVWLEHDAFHWLSTELVNCHIPYIPSPICETYNLSKSDFVPGGICRVCNHIGMTKKKRRWICPVCGQHDHLAHQPALREWFLLMGREMTNKDCREFLRVDRKTATRILTSMTLIAKGGCKNRSYTIDFENYFPQRSKLHLT